MSLKFRRLWQPARAMFWMMLLFNVLSSACAYVLRAWPLNTAGVVVVALVGLMNVACGLLAAWTLMREEPPPRS